MQIHIEVDCEKLQFVGWCEIELCTLVSHLLYNKKDGYRQLNVRQLSNAS